MTYTTYCTQKNGDCSDCSLVNHGRDCKNNPVSSGTDEDGYCKKCGRPVIHCGHWENYAAALNARLNRDKATETRPKPAAEEIADFFEE